MAHGKIHQEQPPAVQDVLALEPGARHYRLRHQYPVLRFKACLQKVALVPFGYCGVRLGVSLDQVLAMLIPIVKATVCHHAGHVLTVEFQDTVVPDAESISDFLIGLPWNSLDDFVVQYDIYGPQAPVSFHILG
jgi:hypothetical protein